MSLINKIKKFFKKITNQEVFIRKVDKMECWSCRDLPKKQRKNCKTCKGTGIFEEDMYYVITTDEKGRKIAFDVDSMK